MDQGDCFLVQILLVVVLVLNETHVAKVAHICTCVPADALGVNVDLSQHLDHLCLIRSVRFGSGRYRRRIDMLPIIMRFLRYFDDRKGESIGYLESAVDVHTYEGAGSSGRKSLRAVFDHFHHHLEQSE